MRVPQLFSRTGDVTSSTPGKCYRAHGPSTDPRTKTDVTEDDLHELGRWLHAQEHQRLDAWAFLVATLLACDGTSRTYSISDGERSIIVRLPQPGPSPATASELAHEYRTLSALADTEVPVPLAYGLCTDDSGLGMPFSVLERRHGDSYAARVEEADADRAEQLADRAVDTLVALHAIAPRSLAVPEDHWPGGSPERELRSCRDRLAARKGDEPAGVAELCARLERLVPPPGQSTIVHGGYRAENLLVDEHDRLTAVLGWQRSTIGDPLTDLALLAVSHDLAARSQGGQASGRAGTTGIIERYAAGTGRDLDGLGFHLGLACLELAEHAGSDDAVDALIERGLTATAA